MAARHQSNIVTFVSGSPVSLAPEPAFLTRSLSSRPLISRPFSCSPPRRARAIRATASANPMTLDTDCHVPVLRPSQGTGITIKAGPPLLELEADLLVIGVRSLPDDAPEGSEWTLPSEIASFDDKVAAGAMREAVADAEFTGKKGTSTDIVRVAGARVKRIVLYGVGDGKPAAVSKAAAFAISKGTSIASVKSAALALDGGWDGGVAAAAEGAIVAAFVDHRFKGTPKKQTPPESLMLVGADGNAAPGIARGQAIAAGVIAAKEVVAAPANSLTPEALADAARLVAKEAGLDIKVLGRKECKELGMGCFLGVSQGSIREPQFIHMTYSPPGEVKSKVALVGKAVTFDTGGYNIKMGLGMALMKSDMGGSGAVLGAAAAIGRVKPAGVEVHFIMPACENMVSDSAIHPGDILTASNGKTVEVLNTDAEGRLCLADALVYAEKLGLDSVVDIATLTGAVVVALGNDVAGLWSPNDQLAEDMIACGAKSGEKLWRMPLFDGYRDELKSKISDLRNIGAGRAASSITAALFLNEFVSTDKWVHLDIASKQLDKNGLATAFGTKTLFNYIEQIAEFAASE